MFTNPLIVKILDHYKKIWAIDTLKALSAWDLEVYMPENGAYFRGQAMGILGTMQQKLLLDNKFLTLIKKVQNDKLNIYEQAVVRNLNRVIEKNKKIPSKLLEEIEETTNQAQIEWRKARENNDFQQFAPHLKKIVKLLRQKTKLIGYKTHPYNVLLDDYEQGLTVEKLDVFFGEIEEPLKNLLQYVQRSSKHTEHHTLENLKYDKGKMRELNNKVLAYLRADKTRLRIDESTHPFTESISVDDVRITTRYTDTNFQNSLTSTIHEYGHALYELQINKDLTTTPLGGGVSLGVHESQSRFFENMIGRSKGFLNIFLQDIKALSPQIAKYVENEGIDGVYRYFNMVKPGLIRVEADEITYHLHIKLRYQIEKDLIEGNIQVKDLPAIWNETMENLLNIKPKSDTEGVLQDIHWSLGAIGYFPTYSIGTFNSGLIKYELEKSIGMLDNLIVNEQGIEKIQAFLKDKIHKHGSTYTPEQLLVDHFNSKFSTQYLINHLEEKYKKIY